MTAGAAPPRRSFWGWLIAALIAFALGALATYALTRNSWGGDEAGGLLAPAADRQGEGAPASGASGAPGRPDLPAETGAGGASASIRAAEAQQAAQVQQVAAQQGGLDARVAAMEQRLARLDLAAEAAAGNAARAEALLIAFAARRAIERGAPLGYLSEQLLLRFGDARPNAVRAVIAASQDPVTIDQLLVRLDALAPAAEEAPAGETALAMLRRQVSQLFVVRRDETPSPAPLRRIERARLFLETGRIEAAVREVRSLPNAAVAADWLADAARLAAAHQALDLIETAAVLDPRDMRDGNGERVQQPGPAG